MFETIREYGQLFAVLLLGLALGAAWMMAIVAPNVAYDRMDGGRANSQVRAMIKAGSQPVAFILLAAGALAILGGALVSGLVSILTALGFVSNRWTLARHKPGETPPGARRRHKTTRVVAVAFTLIFTAAIAIAALLAVFGI